MRTEGRDKYTQLPFTLPSPHTNNITKQKRGGSCKKYRRGVHVSLL